MSKVQMLDVLLSCERVMKVNTNILRGRITKRSIARSRMVAMAACRQLTDFSVSAIGRYFCDRDHSTVLHACERAQTDENLRLLLNAVVADAMKQTPILQRWIDAVPFKTRRTK